MDDEYLKMVKKAPELQDKIEEKPDTLYCDGYHVYIKYPVHDEVTGEDNYGCWSWDKCREKPLWKPEKIKIPREEDLQEIILKEIKPLPITIEQKLSLKKYPSETYKALTLHDLFDEWLRLRSFRGMDLNLNLTMLWLMLIMEVYYGKYWNSETKEWEAIKP